MENIDYLTDLTLCYHHNNYAAIYYERLGKLETDVKLSEKEFKLFKVAVHNLINHLKVNKFTHRVEGTAVKRWVEYINNDMIKKLKNYYEINSLDFDTQVKIDANLVTVTMCKHNNINPNDIIQRAYLANEILGNIKV